tara:strand:- start:49 stop:372 length:324 start_codon:yes stop_codon:yes gene_type:complete
MAFYENTLIARQDIQTSEIKKIIDKYNECINKNSGKVIKIEEWGLLNLSRKIRNYKKGFFIHFKFEGNKDTLSEVKNKMNIDSSIIRHLVVKYKKLNLDTEYFQKQK